MDAHIEIHINIAGLQENRIRLLFDRLKLTDNLTDLSLHVASHRLKGRLIMTGPEAKNADARKPPETSWLPVVDSSSESLTSSHRTGP